MGQEIERKDVHESFVALAICFHDQEHFTEDELKELEYYEVKLVPVQPPESEHLEVLCERGYLDKVDNGTYQWSDTPVYEWTEQAREHDIWDEAEDIDPNYRKTLATFELKSGSMDTTAGQYGAEIPETQFQDGQLEIFEDDDGEQGFRVKINRREDFRNAATVTGKIDEQLID